MFVALAIAIFVVLAVVRYRRRKAKRPKRMRKPIRLSPAPSPDGAGSEKSTKSLEANVVQEAQNFSIELTTSVHSSKIEAGKSPKIPTTGPAP